MPVVQLTSSKTGSLYFGYGSNLSPFQMARRCPSSGVPIAVARLNSWMWIITERGYANIVPMIPVDTSYDTDATSVWGLVYNLTPEDEARLDVYEGCNEQTQGPKNNIAEQQTWKPYEQGTSCYNKLYLPVKVEKWLAPDSKAILGLDESDHNDMILRSLVYVSEQHVVPGRIKHAYVRRMARGARECIGLGVPERWVNNMFSQHGIDKNDPNSFMMI